MTRIETMIGEETRPEVREVGRLILELCGCDARIAALVEQDLSAPEMSPTHCFEALMEYAKKHQRNGCFACGGSELSEGNEVVRVLLEFYKIPEEWLGAGGATAQETSAEPVNLMDLL